MIPNITQNLQSYIAGAIEGYFKDSAKSFPCKVVSYSEGLVEVETLLVKGKNDIAVKIPALQSPYFTLPIQEGDIGIALNCSFLFEPILEGKEIENNILSTQKNGLFFIPLLPKDKQNKETDITFKSAPDQKSSIILNDDNLDFVIAENTKCSISGSTFELGINEKGVLNLSENALSLKLENKQVLNISESELSLKLGNKQALTIGSNITTPLEIEQSTPIALKGSGGSMKDFSENIIKLLDALASGMKGQATEPSVYQAQKAIIEPLIKAMFK